MAFTIQEMTPGTNGIAVAQRSIWRRPIAGADFTTIRLAVGVHFPVTSAVGFGGTPRFYLGLCHDTPNGGPGSDDCRHFLGVRTSVSAWAYSTATTYSTIGATENASHAQMVLIENGAVSASNFGANGGWRFGAISTNNGIAYRSHSILEIRRTGAGTASMSLLRLSFGAGAGGIAPHLNTSDDNVKLALVNPGGIAGVQSFLQNVSENSAWILNDMTSPDTDIDEAANGALNALAVGYSVPNAALITYAYVATE